MANNPYSRNIYTIENQFADALLALVKEFSYDDITASMIIKKSGLSKATFYRHFRDKQDLTAWVFTFGAQRRNLQFQHSARYLQTVSVLKTVKENLVFYRKTLMDDSQNSLLDAVHTEHIRWFESRVKEVLDIDDLSEEMRFTIYYHSLSLVYALRDWVSKGAPGTPEHQAALIISSVPAILQKYIL